jgi:hypothetical protein
MNVITLQVNKANVYDEVAKTTSYVGVKMKDDETAYDRIFTTDDDRMMLERFWVEACNAATEEFKPFIISVSEQPESHGVELERNYQVELELSSSFDTRLQGSIETSLFSFFVASIVAKWCKFTNKAETESYAKDATAAMLDVHSKIYYRKKPQRIIPQ